MNRHIRVATILALAAAATTAKAEQTVGDFYLVPQAGYIWLDNDRGVRDDVYVGLGFGKHISEPLSLEFNVTRSNHDLPGNDDFELASFTVDALGVFARSSRVSPFISIGVGALRDDSDGRSSSTDFAAQVGAGLMITLAEKYDGAVKLNLRPEYKARWSFAKDNNPQDKFNDHMAGIGFMVAFGDARPAPAPAAEPLPPPPPPPAAPPPPADTDGDGVTDDKDKCPDTPRGVAVDENGCPRRGTATLQGVNFEFNSATLTAASRPVLDAVAADIKRYPRLKIELQGHTDSVGGDRYNLTLSEKRAQSVREYLVSQGVGEQQVTAKGYGEAQPAEDNKTEDGRAKNRRVVMEVKENPGEVKIDIEEPKT